MGRKRLALVIYTALAFTVTGCLKNTPAQQISTVVLTSTTEVTKLVEPALTKRSYLTSTAIPSSTVLPTSLPPSTDVPTLAPTLTQLPAATPTILLSRTAIPYTATLTVGSNTTPITIHVPILMYHYLSTPPANADVYRLDLSVKPSDFETQLAYLRDNGYQTISLYDLFGHFSLNAPLPAKPIILTFDDGYRDAYTNAFPLLKKYGMSGTFFIVSDFVNNGYPAYLTWGMIKEMAAAGMGIESHSRTHPDLRNRSIDYLVWQILGPIESITAYTGKRPHFFCYPSGDYDDTVIRVLKSADVWGAVTTYSGAEHGLGDAMAWTRIRIRGTTTLGQFAELVK